MSAVVETLAVTAEGRRNTCLHEAAHAVVHRLSGAFVYRLQVAPIGSTEWVAFGRKGHLVTDSLGLCSVSDCPAGIALRWDGAEGYMKADRALWRQLLVMYQSMPSGKRMAAEARRQLRGWICGTLAGPVEDSIRLGEECWLEPQIGHLDDAAVAEACSWLLPYRDELSYLAQVTTDVLRERETAASVEAIARALEASGILEGDELDALLPPPRRNWPPPPRARRA